MLLNIGNERHLKKRAMLFTAHKPTEPLGGVPHEHDLAEVITDRILDRGIFLDPDGPSYRTKHLGLEGQSQAKVSIILVNSFSGAAVFLEPRN